MAEPAFAGTVHFGLLTMVLCSALLLAGSVLAAVLFFTKRTSAPLAFVALTWSSIAFGTIMVLWLVLSGLDNETVLARFAGESVRDVLFAALWTAYMLTSRRVRSTFVRRLSVKGATDVRAPALAGAAGD